MQVVAANLVPGAAVLIAMGLFCIFVAWIGWWAGRDGDFPDNAVSRRRKELAPMMSDIQFGLYIRFRRPLTTIGAGATIVGIVFLIVEGVSA